MKNDFSWRCTNLGPDKEEQIEGQRRRAEVQISDTLIPLDYSPGVLGRRLVADEEDDGSCWARQHCGKEQK